MKSTHLVPASPGAWRDPSADFWVLAAKTLAGAVTALDDNASQRWSKIDCRLPSPDAAVPISFGKLIDEVYQFIEAHHRRPGYLILVGDERASLTAAFGQLVAQHQVRQRQAAVFHIEGSSNSRSTDAVAACLYQRLRRKWGGVEPPAWVAMTFRASSTVLGQHATAGSSLG